MSTIVVPKKLYAPIQPYQLTRNGRVVTASVEGVMRRSANQSIAYCGKELFSSPGFVGSLPTGVASRNRWRFRFRTGPYTTQIKVWMTMGRQTTGLGAPTNPSASFVLLSSGGATISTSTLYYGANGTTPSDTPNEFGHATYTIDVDPSTEYQGLFSEDDFAKLVSGLVWEIGPELDTANGYVHPTIGSGAPILDDQREKLVTIANALWRGGGAQVLNWTADIQSSPQSITSNSIYTNLLDLTVTGAPSASSPGYTLDMTGKALSQQATGVPIKMWVRASNSGSGTGQVYLKDAADNTIASVIGIAGAEAWYSATGVLPASSAKYDLQIRRSLAGGQTDVYAVSIYENAF